MWSLEERDRHHKGVSSSSSSSRCSPSSSVLPQTPKRRTMEELWKDISLNASPPPLDRHPVYHGRQADCFLRLPSMVLQDFLAGPLNRPLYPPQAAAKEPSLPPLETALSLNSAKEFLGEADQQANTQSNSSSNNTNGNVSISCDFSAVPPRPAALFSLCSRKRSTTETHPGGADRHQKRMIKNRESAARSRARKQAYTIELEMEVSHLQEENAKLKKQNEELMKNQETVTKSALRRTSTALF
ncbi:protein FD-like [Zingiber officinale]|uniref:protein FD-like n=1 Tax=Zingiber officinale TaxID=94328 RepID=UPI001C4ABEBE|nr:protein FD-like [Zingiber officinale]